MRTLTVGLLMVITCVAADAVGQTTEGSIRGYVRDEQRGVLPGVTITATSPAASAPAIAVTDQEGYFRLLNLPPGDYAVTAELAGFSKFVRENILVRAGLNLTVDIDMKVGTLEETITVTGESPLLETSSAVQAVNISGELQQALPLAARKHWSEFLRLAPGVVSSDTTTDQASVFYVHGAGIVSFSTLIDGADMSSAVNPWTGYVALPDDTISDVQIKTSGLDASAPLGMGAASNVVAASGTNVFKGKATFAYTPKSWISRNTPGATSQTMSVTQPEMALGGPLQRDRWWFFTSYRRRLGALGLSRPADQIADMQVLDAAFEPFDNDIEANIWFAKVTGQLTSSHQVSGFYSYDTTARFTDGVFTTDHFSRGWIGGDGVATRLTSAWNNWLTSRVGFSWNDKAAWRELVRGDDAVPSRPVFRDAFLSSGRLVGSTQRATLDNIVSETQTPSSKWTLSGDMTMYRTGWLGSHELQAGFSLQPRMHRKLTIEYANNGFALEELVLRDPTNAAAGTMPFHRRIFDAGSGIQELGRFGDNAFYVQDAWRPTPRLTMNAGVRVDQVTRHDELFDVEVQRSVEVAPRVGVNYVLTADQRNAARVSFMRLHDAPQVNHQAAGSDTIGFRDLYDLNLDGVFDAVFVTPGSSRINPNRIIDPDYHQPFVDEWAAGYRRQLPGQASVDVGFIHRDYRDRTALVEENAIYTGNVFSGYRNEALNEINLLTSNRWNWPVYNAVEMVGTKRTDRIQLLASYTHVWSHLAGTWQPNDPASFIQPSAFTYERGLDGNDNRSASRSDAYSAGTAGPEWTDNVFQISGTYQAPWNFVVASSYTVLKGWWSGPILDRLTAPDPQFGPPTVRLSNGRVVSNPLATTIRFAFPTRSEGQYMLPARHYMNLRVGRDFRLGKDRRLEVDVDVFNLLNHAGFQGFLSGANQLYSTNYGKGGNVQPPRTVQLGLKFSF